MALLPIPVWTIPPDWSDNVRENLEWLTSIPVSRIGAEQRQALRLSPRRTFDFTVRPTGVERQYYDALLSTPDQGSFYLPLWHAAAYLRVAAAASATTLVIAGARKEIAGASVVFIQGDAPYLFELAEVTSAVMANGNTTLTLAAGLASGWPKNAGVFPAVVAQFSGQPSFERFSDDAEQSQVKFDLVGANDWPYALTAPPEYLDYPVITLTTDEGGGQAGGYFRYIAMVDSKTGLRVRVDQAGIPFPLMTSADFVKGRSASDEIRSLLYYMRGRLTAAWMLFPTIDFTLVRPVAALATTIYVQRNGFTDLGGPRVGRQDIAIQRNNGTVSYHRITGSAVFSDHVEALNLSPEVTSALAPSSVARISFMALGRLDQDGTELAHQTDSDGVCSFALAIKAVPDLRTGEVWAPEPPPFTDLEDGTACAPYPAKRFWARIPGGLWNQDANANPATGVGAINIGSISGYLFPIVGINTGFFGGQELTVNFGGIDPVETLPSRVAVWNSVAKLNPDDAAPGLTLSEDLLTVSAGSENTGRFVRATYSTETQLDLRYFEFSVGATSPQNWFVGVANAAFPLTQGFSVSGPIAYVADDGRIYVGGGWTGITLTGLSGVNQIVEICIKT